MPRFAQVVAKSNLIQLDREFDFVIPEQLESEIRIGQQVSFPFGRAKKLQHGFVVGLSETSEYATSELAQILHPTPVLSPELLSFCRQVADRQCVAIGEILSAAIPDHMARTQLTSANETAVPSPLADQVAITPELSTRSAILTTGRTVSIDDQEVADWANIAMQSAHRRLFEGKSSIICAPEQDDIEQLEQAAKISGLGSQVVVMNPGMKRSERFRAFHKILELPAAIVIGTRSALYAPANNLDLIAVYDDLDESLREQGSPFTHARELALIRAGQDKSLLFLAPYRSVEIQRLVEIGYLSDHDTKLPAPRISFTEPGSRDESTSKLIRERLEHGPVLVLLPRKGSSAALYCSGCGERLRCSCGGMIWEPSEKIAICRICNKPHIKCQSCGSAGIRRGRTGSTRKVAEYGKQFPQISIAEATADKKPSGLKAKRQLVVATPSAAPRVQGGYAGILIQDADVWLSRQALNSETIAFRDWMSAIELLAIDGRVVIDGIDKELGQAFALQQHRQLASSQLRELRALGLPPATRIASIQTEPENLDEALAIAKSSKAKALRVDPESGTALFSFSYQDGPAFSKALRGMALKTSARFQGGAKRRGLRIVMDDPNAL